MTSAFIVDTGVQPHPELGANLVKGFDATNTNNTGDCMGHGTHVAGTVGSEHYGVAPGTKIVPVKVFAGCSESTTTQLILRGLNYVAESKARPAVVNLSLGGQPDQALDDALSAVLRKGVHVVVAAGNDSADACNSSPSRMGGKSDVISVGATTKTDDIASFSNTGTCVNLYAPGQDIESLTPQGGTVARTGTSMASPHVTGAVALYLANHPSVTPEESKKALMDLATANVLKYHGVLSDNKLLFVEVGAQTQSQEEQSQSNEESDAQDSNATSERIK